MNNIAKKPRTFQQELKTLKRKELVSRITDAKDFLIDAESLDRSNILSLLDILKGGK